MASNASGVEIAISFYVAVKRTAGRNVQSVTDRSAYRIPIRYKTGACRRARRDWGLVRGDVVAGGLKVESAWCYFWTLIAHSGRMPADPWWRRNRGRCTSQGRPFKVRAERKQRHQGGGKGKKQDDQSWPAEKSGS